jgi:hypothetical protein
MLPDEFDRIFAPEHIEPQLFAYTTKVTDTYRWELEVRRDGLFYKDISGEFHGAKNEVTAQSFGDFWCYGPLLPVPQRSVREKLLALIRRALPDDAALAHFPLFDYPSTNGTLHWSTGDYHASEFVIVRDHGVEYGRENFHDGLVFLSFVSFEHCLTRPAEARRVLGAGIWREIVALLPAEPYAFADPEADAAAAAAADRDNAGPTLPELFNQLSDPATAAAAERQLIERAATASARDRHDMAHRLWREVRSEQGVEILLGLLDEEMDTDYWQSIVFNGLFDRRESPTARTFVLDALRGDNELYLKKAIGVVGMWGVYGEPGLGDRTLLTQLYWGARDTPEFRSALETVIGLVEKNGRLRD